MLLHARQLKRFGAQLLIMILVFSLLAPAGGLAQTQDPSSQAAVLVREGNDFATRVLRDPWDMDSFRDVSQWINHIPGAELQNLKFQNGVFTAQNSSSPGYFFLLFAGYPPGLKHGKIGARYPIPTSKYGCFYMAAYIQSQGQDDFHVSWQADQNLVDNGFTFNTKVDNTAWRLYAVNLRTWGFIAGEKWTARSHWQGLRVQPTTKGGTPMAIDWVRLTDCSPVIHTLTGLPAGDFSLWVGVGSPERQILAVDSFQPSGGNYDWDIQGLAPGTYNYYVKNGSGATVKQGQITVNATPIASFVRPSPLSGDDYSTQAGNPWDMTSSNDLTSIKCAFASTVNGLLLLDTLPPSQSPRCVRSGANEMDPNVNLNTPAPADIRAYRYLSFRHLINGGWSVPEEGMVVRWIWATSNPGNDCHYVSREVSLDVFWDTYTVDLHEDWNGVPVEADPSHCALVPWRNQSLPVVKFRFDPNENITPATFHQEVDWIRLTRVDRISQGQPFPVMIALNKPANHMQSLTFYYTTSPSNPTQNPAKAYSPQPVSGGGASSFSLFLPAVRHGVRDLFVEALQADFTYQWDTSGVTPGTYYLCVNARDSADQAIYCSEAPMEVLTP